MFSFQAKNKAPQTNVHNAFVACIAILKKYCFFVKYYNQKETLVLCFVL